MRAVSLADTVILEDTGGGAHVPPGMAMMGFALAEGGSFPSPAGSLVGRGKVLGPPGHTF